LFEQSQLRHSSRCCRAMLSRVVIGGLGAVLMGCTEQECFSKVQELQGSMGGCGSAEECCATAQDVTAKLNADDEECKDVPGFRDLQKQVASSLEPKTTAACDGSCVNALSMVDGGLDQCGGTGTCCEAAQAAQDKVTESSFCNNHVAKNSDSDYSTSIATVKDSIAEKASSCDPSCVDLLEKESDALDQCNGAGCCEIAQKAQEFIEQSSFCNDLVGTNASTEYAAKSQELENSIATKQADNGCTGGSLLV